MMELSAGMLDDDGAHCYRSTPLRRHPRRKAAADDLDDDGDWLAGPSKVRRRRHSPGSSSAKAQPSDRLRKRKRAFKVLQPRPERRLLFAPATAPPGPTDLESSLMILAAVAQTIAMRGAQAGLDLSTRPSHPGALNGTWFLTSSYSGWGSAEMAAGQARLHLAAAGAWVPIVTSYSATDYKRHCRTALQSHKPDTAPQHVMNDLLERIPASLRSKLTDKAAERRKAITNIFAESKAMSGLKLALAERKRLVKSMGDEWVALAREELAKVEFTRDLTCSCVLHPGCQCPPAPPAGKQDFWLEVAGTTCVAWSTMSTTSWGWLDESGLPCLVWCYWVLGAKPDAVAHEIVGGTYRPQVMIDILSPVFEANSIISSPTFWGVPSHRTRRYSVFLRRCFELLVVPSTLSAPQDSPPHLCCGVPGSHCAAGLSAAAGSSSFDRRTPPANFFDRRALPANFLRDEFGGQAPARFSALGASAGPERDAGRDNAADPVGEVDDEQFRHLAVGHHVSSDGVLPQPRGW